jgi:hypothetical protein
MSEESQPLEAPEAAAIEERPLTALDGRVVQYWRLSGLLGWIIPLLLLLGLAIGVGGGVFHQPGPGLILWGAWVIVVIIWSWWYPSRAYAAWGYRRDGKVLELHSGVWFRVVRLLPLSRLQHVDLQRGPLERSFGLASLVLYTAGTQEAAIEIPGLADETARQLRDELVACGGDDGV